MTRAQKRKDLVAGAAIIVLVIVLIGVAACIREAMHIDAQSTSETAPVETIYIVYTDEAGELHAAPYEETTYTRAYYPLTMDEREWLAEILAGKAADRKDGCQRMVATVIYNDIMDCQCDLNQAIKKYGLNDVGTPTAEIYEIVDAVFYNGEYMLDDDVLWFNDVDHPSAFHDSLVFVCECDGIAFYKEHRPAIVPGGAAE